METGLLLVLRILGDFIWTQLLLDDNPYIVETLTRPVQSHIFVIIVELCARLVELLGKLLDLAFFLAGSSSVLALARLLYKILNLV